MAKASIFGIIFTGVDLIVFALIYFLFGLLAKNYAVLDALSTAGIGVISRLIYLQAVIQFLFLTILRYLNWHENILVVLVISVASLLLTSVYFVNDYTLVFKYFTIDVNGRVLGQGLGLLASGAAAWLIVFKWTRLSKIL